MSWAYLIKNIVSNTNKIKCYTLNKNKFLKYLSTPTAIKQIDKIEQSLDMHNEEKIDETVKK